MAAYARKRRLAFPALAEDEVYIEVIVDNAVKAMDRTGYNGHIKAENRRIKTRTVFNKWKMTRGDAAWLDGLIASLIRK